MADQLIAGTTLVEKESRSIGDIPIGGIVEWNDTFGNLPEGFVETDGSTVNDPQSSWNGTATPNLNTEYYSINAAAFTTQGPDVDDIARSNNTADTTLNGVGLVALAPIELPNGVIITAAVVYASVSTEDWDLRSHIISDTSSSITHATAALNTEDTTITTPTIDNSTRKYLLKTDIMDATDIIRGALITYTPRNKFIMRVR